MTTSTPDVPGSFLSRLRAYRPNPSVLLFIATIAAVVIANSPWSHAYMAFLNFPVQIVIGGVDVLTHEGRT